MSDYKGSRWTMIVILSLCIAICYIFRTSISTTIIEISKEMSINENIQGYILSAFSFGYVAFMLIGGLLVDRFGTNRILTITMIILSLSTILLGFAHYWICILILRFLIGALEAPAFPACARFVNKNFGTTERGRATSIFDTGSYVGAAICVPIIVFFISKYSWRESQYFFGILGLVWVFLWFLFTKNKEKISDESQKEKGKNNTKVILKFLSNKKILGASFGAFCYNYAKSFFLTWMPSYLFKDLGFSILTIGFVATIPLIGAVIGNLSSGILADVLISRGISVTYARKLPLCIGMLFSCVIILTPFVQSSAIIICLLTFSFAMNISASPSIWAIPGDIAPSNQYVGTIGGIQNTFANIAGIVAPIITGYIVYNTGNFAIVLIISGGLSILGTLSYWFVVGELASISLIRKKEEII